MADGGLTEPWTGNTSSQCWLACACFERWRCIDGDDRRALSSGSSTGWRWARGLRRTRTGGTRGAGKFGRRVGGEKTEVLDGVMGFQIGVVRRAGEIVVGLI